MRSRVLSCLAACVIASALLVPKTAKAFPDGPYGLDKNTEEGHTKRIHAWGELGLFAGGIDGADLFVLSPIFGARLKLTDKLLLEGQWGFVHARVKDDRGGGADNVFRPGNPYAAIHYQETTAKGVTYRLGAGLTAPVASFPDSDPVRARNLQLAYQVAAGIRGNWNVWLWEPFAISLVIPVRIERRKPTGFIWGVEVDLAIMVPISSDKEELETGVQMGGDLGYQMSRIIRIGSSFHLVILPQRTADKTQIAAEPYLRVGDDKYFVAGRLLFNIDNPRGFSFDKNKVWGLRLAGGVTF